MGREWTGSPLPALSEEEQKRWVEIAERREREQQNYARSQKSTGSELTNPKCYVDISIGSMPIGRLNVELYSDVTPLAAENFRGLCTGEYGHTRDGVKLDFIDSIFHLVHPSGRRGGGSIVGGDISCYVGSGGASVYGSPFPDEGFKHRHTGPGLLSMDSQGPNNNTSRFSITTAKCPHLDYKNVVFGKVTDGLAVIERMEQVDLEPNSSPKQEIRVTFCGQQNRTVPYVPDDTATWRLADEENEVEVSRENENDNENENEEDKAPSNDSDRSSGVPGSEQSEEGAEEET